MNQKFKPDDVVTWDDNGDESARVVKVNLASVMVELPDGNVIKRHIRKHNVRVQTVSSSESDTKDNPLPTIQQLLEPIPSAASEAAGGVKSE